MAVVARGCRLTLLDFFPKRVNRFASSLCDVYENEGFGAPKRRPKFPAFQNRGTSKHEPVFAEPRATSPRTTLMRWS